LNHRHAALARVDRSAFGSSLVINAESKSETLRLSVLRSARGAARAGFRRAAFVVVLIADAAVLLGLAMTAFGVGAGRGWSLPWFVLGAYGFFIIAVVARAFLNAGFRGFGGLIRRVRRRRATALELAAADGVAEGVARDASARPAAPPSAWSVVRRRWRRIVLAMLFPSAAYGIGIFVGGALDYGLEKFTNAANLDYTPHGTD
jgi:hypothetical protein